MHVHNKPSNIDDMGTMYWLNDSAVPHSFDDQPAVIYASGDAYWYKNGLKHRENAPAVIYVDKEIEFWFNGLYYSSIYEWAKIANVSDETIVEILLIYGNGEN
jgi:hypothetical protein